METFSKCAESFVETFKGRRHGTSLALHFTMKYRFSWLLSLTLRFGI
jgi:hypothetical protein